MIQNRLKEQRSIKKISQRNLAEMIGVSQQTIGSWETGRTEPDQVSLNKLADFFGVSTDYLLGRTQDKSNTQILDAVSNNPELVDFTKELIQRESMQLLFKQAKSLSDSDIGKIIKIIKAIEDEEDKQNGID